MKKLVKRMVMGMMVATTMVAGMAGCAKKNDLPTVAIVQLVEHPSLDTIRESIIADLAAKGYIDGQSVNIHYKNAQGDPNNITTICQKFAGDQVDVMVAIATPTAQGAFAATKDIPIIFSAVTDPVAAKLVLNPEAPEGNVTGTSDAIPVDRVFDLCQTLTPQVKTMGFLYTASEINSQVVVEEGIEYAKALGMNYEVMTITNTSELKQAAELLAAKADAIYTPIDNNIASAMPVLSQVGRELQIPVYVGADSLVMDGGYATVGINYEKLGVKTSEMVAEVLKGTKVKDLPVVTLDEFDTVVNKTTAEAIGAPVPETDVIIVE